MDTSNGIDTLVAQVNDLLKAGEPANISIDDHSGHVGYKPQAVVDAMNKVFKYGMWGFRELSNELADGKDKDGVIKPILAIAKVEVWLKGVDFQPTAWGQSRITKGDMGDARKGAQTDAIKKGLSYFSVGNRAYLGILKEVVKDLQQNARSNGGVAPTPAQQARPTPVPPQTPAQTETNKEPTPLNKIPVKSAIKKDVENGGYAAPGGGVLKWVDFVELAFSRQLNAKQFTRDQILNTEWNPKYCEHAAAFLATLKKAA